MHASDVERYLSYLGDELADLGIQSSIRVLLLGGAFMLTQVNVRRTTDDIDVLPLDEGGIDEATGAPIAVALWNAAHAVAARENLPSTWFNTIIAEFVQTAGAVPTGTLWHKYGPLEIYSPPKEYIFVLKLIANRRKDQRDIRALCRRLKVRTRQQAQHLLDIYIPDAETQQFFALSDTLEKLFPL
jgi:hypothetical protein